MNNLKRGTVMFGIFLGCLCVLLGMLVMLLGFWKTLILAALFAVGYFIGAIDNKKDFVRETVDKVVPKQKSQETIDFRAEVEKQQEAMYSRESLTENETAENSDNFENPEEAETSRGTESVPSVTPEEDEA